MNFTLEQIDVLRQRADVSYEKAKEALEKCNGDMVEAVIYLEKNNKMKKNCDHSDKVSKVVDTIKKLAKKGQETRFVMQRNDVTAINVPVNAVVLTTVIALPVTIGGVLVGLFSNYKIRFVKPNGIDFVVNKVIDKVSTAVTNLDKKTELTAK